MPKNYCKNNSIVLIIPTIDTELLTLSEHREDFLKLGISIIISDTVLIKACGNKNLTTKLLNKIADHNYRLNTLNNNDLLFLAGYYFRSNNKKKTFCCRIRNNRIHYSIS